MARRQTQGSRSRHAGPFGHQDVPSDEPVAALLCAGPTDARSRMKVPHGRHLKGSLSWREAEVDRAPALSFDGIGRPRHVPRGLEPFAAFGSVQLVDSADV